MYKLLEDVKVVFLDTEFTGEHQFTSLVSIAIVTLQGNKIYRSLNDYKTSQVNSWLKKNVLSKIDKAQSVDSYTAATDIFEFLQSYSEGQKIHIVSAGLSLDIILLIELFSNLEPNTTSRFTFHSLPHFLRHNHGIDLNTLFRVCGLNPSIDRAKFIGLNSNELHSALFDAEVNRMCFLKLIKNPALKNILRSCQ